MAVAGPAGAQAPPKETPSVQAPAAPALPAAPKPPTVEKVTPAPAGVKAQDAAQGFNPADLFKVRDDAPKAAPKPLFRDPVYDGAADASIVYNHRRKLWTMFYTNRRATEKHPDLKDVSWVHATAIGIATSKDGLTWTYGGEAKIPKSCTGVTLWAPELYYERGTYHMFLTVVPGIYPRWGIKEATSFIVHLTSADLKSWKCNEKLDLQSNRVIDASVLKLDDGSYRVWYKDEHAKLGSRIFLAAGPTLRQLARVSQTPVVNMGAEGPKVFRFKDQFWMIADAWKGLIVLRSDDALNWTLQPDRILAEPGKLATDNKIGQHADVIVNNGRAFIYYFVHQGNEPQAANDPHWNQRTVIQVAELIYKDGALSVDRNAAVTTPLVPPPR